MGREFGQDSSTAEDTPNDPALRAWPFGPLTTAGDNQTVHVTVTGIIPSRIANGWDGIQVSCYNGTTNALISSQEFNAGDVVDDAGGILRVDFTPLTNGQRYVFKARQFKDY